MHVPATVSAAARDAARDLSGGRRFSVPRMVLDAALIAALVAVGEWSDSLVAQVFLAGMIGVFPMHDLLVHGHEAIHGNASRSPRLNGLMLWLPHAIVGISGRAHRAFHLDHHREIGTDGDPEAIVHGASATRLPGIGVLRITALSHLYVNGHPWRGGRTRISKTAVLIDVGAAAVLHSAIVAVFGPRMWLLYLVVPATIGLSVVSAARALAEHLGERQLGLAHSRPYAARRMGQLGWSNIDHHLEHHLCPQVPWHKLPILRRRLLPVYASHGLTVEHGLFHTAVRTVMESHS
jgi:fatty acid desaturase